jgi:hypothetical protein
VPNPPRLSFSKTSWRAKVHPRTPRTLIIESVSKIRALVFKALNEPRCALRCRPAGQSVLFGFRVTDAELRWSQARIEIADLFRKRGHSARELPEGPPSGTLCTWIILAGNRGILGFRSRVRESRPGLLAFELPGRLAYTQKRAELRYEIPAGYEIEARYHLPTLQRARMAGPFRHSPVFDLSATGISLLVPVEDRDSFPPGRIIQDLTLRLRNQTLVLKAEAIGWSPDPALGSDASGKDREPRVRVRFVFRNAPDEFRDFIRMYVLEHLVQYDSFSDT